MNDENRPQQVPANADGNLRETHDDESALHSDWGSDESIRESVGDGQPRDDLDEHREELQARDDQERLLIDESGARTPDSPRGYGALTQNGRVSPPVDPLPQVAAVEAQPTPPAPLWRRYLLLRALRPPAPRTTPTRPRSPPKPRVGH